MRFGPSEEQPGLLAGVIPYECDRFIHSFASFALGKDMTAGAKDGQRLGQRWKKSSDFMERLGVNSRKYGGVLNTTSMQSQYGALNTPSSRGPAQDGSTTWTESIMSFADRDNLSGLCFPLSESSHPRRFGISSPEGMISLTS
jgi:hypothetical protein